MNDPTASCGVSLKCKDKGTESPYNPCHSSPQQAEGVFWHFFIKIPPECFLVITVPFNTSSLFKVVAIHPPKSSPWLSFLVLQSSEEYPLGGSLHPFHTYSLLIELLPVFLQICLDSCPNR